VFSLFDTYTGGFPLLVIGFLELIIISYVYGTTVTNILTIVKEVGVCVGLCLLCTPTLNKVLNTHRPAGLRVAV